MVSFENDANGKPPYAMPSQPISDTEDATPRHVRIEKPDKAASINRPVRSIRSSGTHTHTRFEGQRRHSFSLSSICERIGLYWDLQLRVRIDRHTSVPSNQPGGLWCESQSTQLCWEMLTLNFKKSSVDTYHQRLTAKAMSFWHEDRTPFMKHAFWSIWRLLLINNPDKRSYHRDHFCFKEKLMCKSVSQKQDQHHRWYYKISVW